MHVAEKTAGDPESLASSTEQRMANQSSGVASSTEPKEPTRG